MKTERMVYWSYIIKYYSLSQSIHRQNAQICLYKS